MPFFADFARTAIRSDRSPTTRHAGSEPSAAPLRFAIPDGCCAGNAIQGRSSDTGADGTDGAARKHAARRMLRLCGIACTRQTARHSLPGVSRTMQPARYSVPGIVSIIHGRSSSITSAGEHRTRDISAPRRLAKAWSTTPKPNHTIRHLKCDRDHQPMSIGLSGSPCMWSGGRSWQPPLSAIDDSALGRHTTTRVAM